MIITELSWQGIHIKADHPRNTKKGGVCINYEVLRLIKKDGIIYYILATEY